MQAGSDDKAAQLIAAIDQISGGALYTFELYQRVVLPVDGFVFWVKATQVNPAWLGAYSRGHLAGVGFNGNQARAAPPLTPQQELKYSFQVQASVHLSQDLQQESTETYVSQAVLFTTKTQVRELDAIAPDHLYVVTLPNGARVAFSSQRNRYELAGLWHYHGRAVYSTLASQLVDDARQFQPTLQIVSNSLPLWIALSTQQVPIFPAELSPLNFAPPYVTADIQSTEAIQQTPLYDRNTSQTQLVTDRIRFTTYGLNNDAVLDLQKTILDTSMAGDYGIMNMPVPVDVKKPQPEFLFIAQAKTLDLQVNYYQNRARDIARKLIESAFITLTPA